MSSGAKVTSIEVLREFRPALIKFIDEARASLVAAESEAQRTLQWLRSERQGYWKREIRHREDEIVRCKTELFNKQRSATGDPRSAVEERKALDRAIARLDEARQKAENTRRWMRQLEKEHMQYRGMVQSLSGQLVALENGAVMDLDRMAAALDAYVSMEVPSTDDGGAASAGGSRGGGDAGFGNGGERVRLSPVREYRVATPGPGRRRRAEEAGAEEAWVREELERVERHRQAEAIERLEMRGEDARGLWVSVSPGALRERRVYLERCEPVGEWDSGWYVAAVGDGEEPVADKRELERVRVEALVESRPDLECVLGLGRGSLVVVDGGRVLSVTAANDMLVYAADAMGDDA